MMPPASVIEINCHTKRKPAKDRMDQIKDSCPFDKTCFFRTPQATLNYFLY